MQLRFISRTISSECGIKKELFCVYCVNNTYKCLVFVKEVATEKYIYVEKRKGHEGYALSRKFKKNVTFSFLEKYKVYLISNVFISLYPA